MAKPFVKGHDPRRGHGLPGRSGRKPAAWKEQCEAALKESQAVPVLQSIISGDLKEKIIGPAGQEIVGETKNSDRLGAIKFLASYAHGQPTEHTEVTGELVIRTVRTWTPK